MRRILNKSIFLLGVAAVHRIRRDAPIKHLIISNENLGHPGA